MIAESDDSLTHSLARRGAASKEAGSEGAIGLANEMTFKSCESERRGERECVKQRERLSE